MTTDSHDFESPWQSKIWGSVQHVFNSPDVAVSVLKVIAGFRCSHHLHRFRCNQFSIVSGRVAIWEWVDEGDLFRNPDRPTMMSSLVPGQSIQIRSNRPHMFEVIESGIIVEIYTPDGGPVDIDDIVRFDEGGPV